MSPGVLQRTNRVKQGLLVLFMVACSSNEEDHPGAGGLGGSGGGGSGAAGASGTGQAGGGKAGASGGAGTGGSSSGQGGTGGGPSQGCSNYCERWYYTQCHMVLSTYSNSADCVAQCATFNQTQLLCRYTSLTMILGDADRDPYCWHAVGQMNAPADCQ